MEFGMARVGVWLRTHFIDLKLCSSFIRHLHRFGVAGPKIVFSFSGATLHKTHWLWTLSLSHPFHYPDQGIWPGGSIYPSLRTIPCHRTCCEAGHRARFAEMALCWWRREVYTLCWPLSWWHCYRKITMTPGHLGKHTELVFLNFKYTVQWTLRNPFWYMSGWAKDWAEVHFNSCYLPVYPEPVLPQDIACLGQIWTKQWCGNQWVTVWVGFKPSCF